VRDTARRHERRSRVELDSLAREVERHPSLEDVLVVAVMDVKRRHVARATDRLDERVAPTGCGSAHVDPREVVDEPPRLRAVAAVNVLMSSPPSSDRLTPFSCVVLALVGGGGAGPHDLTRMMRQQGGLYWSAAESQWHAEPKRLERLG
jgi:hypothetical protein